MLEPLNYTQGPLGHRFNISHYTESETHGHSSAFCRVSASSGLKTSALQNTSLGNGFTYCMSVMLCFLLARDSQMLFELLMCVVLGDLTIDLKAELELKIVQFGNEIKTDENAGCSEKQTRRKYKCNELPQRPAHFPCPCLSLTIFNYSWSYYPLP